MLQHMYVSQFSQNNYVPKHFVICLIRENILSTQLHIINSKLYTSAVIRIMCSVVTGCVFNIVVLPPRPITPFFLCVILHHLVTVVLLVGENDGLKNQG